MKFILVMSFFGFQFSNAQHNDWKEHGLKGNVKSIIAVHYDNAVLSGKNWFVVDTLTFLYKRTLYFNTIGNLDSVITEYNSETGLGRNKLTSVFRNKSKVGLRQYDIDNISTETSTITWTNKHEYKVNTINVTGETVMELIVRLDKNFREIGGEDKTYANGTLETQMNHENTFDSESLIFQVRYFDVLSQEQYVVEYRHQKLDRFGNPIETALINLADESLRRFVIRHIQYY